MKPESKSHAKKVDENHIIELSHFQGVSPLKKTLSKTISKEGSKKIRRIDADGKLKVFRFLTRKGLNKWVNLWNGDMIDFWNFRCCRVSRRWKANIGHYSPWWLKARKLYGDFGIVAVPVSIHMLSYRFMQ